MKLLQDLPRNPRYSILLEPVWAIPGTIVLFYAPLYMKEAGLSDIEIGLINSVNLYFAFIFQLFAGSITNKLGRKRTTLIFDLIAWSVPMFIWAELLVVSDRLPAECNLQICDRFLQLSNY
ncbi:MFS transporter [Paenibacillus pabuli]|uniref:MFS transporter n=1 Tax=Paenibacillus pabuli TaxID=1472 RepID=A0ABX9BDS7_9BACL|nr:MFS transporter [Paenibacillus pabuli]RAI87270.1 MFS transporter [Paenibacillus pabuli]